MANGPKFLLSLSKTVIPKCYLLSYGTGSYPPFENGLHRNILFIAKKPPFMAPYFSIASMAYCEHVG